MNLPENNSVVYTIQYNSWRDSVPPLLEASRLLDKLAATRRVIIKPNLVEPQDPPITTPVELVEALIVHLHDARPDLEIIVAEGCGSSANNTWQIFEALGYLRLAELPSVNLMDLNTAPLVHLQNKNCRRWPEMYLPEIIFDSFLISVPVLKAHSLAGVTLTMKNMIGLAPPSHYQRGGSWKKASFHQKIHPAIYELNCYRSPDFTLLDATVGMQEAHLWGPVCDPPPNRLAAGYDPVAIDSYGCSLLNLNWNTIGHLVLAHKRLGNADPLFTHEI